MNDTKRPPFVKPKKGQLIDLKPGQQLDPEYQQRAQASWQKTLDSGQALVMTPQAIGARLAVADDSVRALWGMPPRKKRKSRKQG